jgi:hypothetical protein
MRNELQASKQKEKERVQQKETCLKRVRLLGRTTVMKQEKERRSPFLF